MTHTHSILAADQINRRLEFSSLPQGWAAVGSIVLLLAVLYAIVHFYGREKRTGASQRVRGFLAGLRCLVILLLAAIWLEPVLATYIHRKIESATLLLVDGSASMSLRDRYAQPEEAQHVAKVVGGNAADAAQMTRAQLVETVLGSDSKGLIQKLANNNPVDIYQFGDKLTHLGQVSGSEVKPAASQPTNNA